MYVLLTIACLLSIGHINGIETAFLSDDTTYNPCGTIAGVYFYSHPQDSHQYYQCDESGIAYLRSCGELVWDELSTSCNWKSAVVPPEKVVPTVPTTTAPSWPTPTWPPTTSTPKLTWPSTTTSTPELTWPSTTTTTSTPSTSTASIPSSSVCAPIDPCGAHGVCVESPPTVFSSARRFACICTENWFGRLCDKEIDELTTPAKATSSDQDKNLPVKTIKDPKLIFFGLKAGDPVEELQPKKN